MLPASRLLLLILVCGVGYVVPQAQAQPLEVGVSSYEVSFNEVSSNEASSYDASAYEDAALQVDGAQEGGEQQPNGHAGAEQQANSHERDAGQQTGGHDGAAGQPHTEPPIWLILPFILLLVMIATGPLLYPHHWHQHYPKYAVGLGLIVAGYYLIGLDDFMSIFHAMEEYLSFIALVASLFIAASGIFLNINARGRPSTNVAVLFVGSVVANVIATTGAAMLFIRPYMRLNKGRLRPYHIVFFIFLIANVGGALTPIGDPPLFLGFLRGVPFFWTLTNLWYIWLPTTAILLMIFYVIDSRNKAMSPDIDPTAKNVELIGHRSFFWVGVVVVSVFIDPSVFEFVPEIVIGGFQMPFGIREVIMFSVCYFGYRYALDEALEKNQFSFEPIREVGWLFLGIFATMQPALQLISAFAAENAAALTADVFYWATGVLSAVLDNAPTYLNFLAASMGKFGVDVGSLEDVRVFAEGIEQSGANSHLFLQAISIAAVFFGAATYIGNAPNFMVKAIAEGNGVECPSFMGYVVKYSITILLPVYFVVYVVFFSGWI